MKGCGVRRFPQRAAPSLPLDPFSTAPEKAYLAMLAARLNLPAELVHELPV